MTNEELRKDLELLATLFWSAAVDLKHAIGVTKRLAENPKEAELAEIGSLEIQKIVDDLTMLSNLIEESLP